MTKSGEFGEPVEFDAAGRLVSITNPYKPVFPTIGVSKLDVATSQWADEPQVDLDPSPGQTLDASRGTALLVRLYFAERGIRCDAKTTGSQGMHIDVRVAGGDDSFALRGASVVVANDLAWEHPDLATDQWRQELQVGTVFVDFNQNAPPKNVFGARGVRPRVGAQGSTAIDWDDVASVDPDELTIRTVPNRLAELGGPWADMDEHPQDVGPLVERLANDLANDVPDAPRPPVYPKMPNEPPRVQPSQAHAQTDSL